MEAYFDGLGGDGRRMMRETASVQVNVDADEGGWRLLHSLAPVLAAMFANSPGPGRRSDRLGVWLRLDRTRCAPVGGSSMAAAWVDYALAARVMFVRAGPAAYAPVDGPMTLADWVCSGHPLGYPTADDVAYHLTTLFPPVRPRGWLELRFLDALPSPWWQAAVAITAALLDDPGASAVAALACRGAAELWSEAAQFGVSHPLLGDAADACVRAALPVVDPALAPVVADFAERYTFRRRCPADDARARVAAWA
jgi:glutamate--cysteine ligase